jgi:hypothetical protein
MTEAVKRALRIFKHRHKDNNLSAGGFGEVLAAILLEGLGEPPQIPIKELSRKEMGEYVLLQHLINSEGDESEETKIKRDKLEKNYLA